MLGNCNVSLSTDSFKKSFNSSIGNRLCHSRQTAWTLESINYTSILNFILCFDSISGSAKDVTECSLSTMTECQRPLTDLLGNQQDVFVMNKTQLESFCK